MNALDLQLILQLQAQVAALVSGGGVALGPVGTNPNANAATQSGVNLNLELANATFAGLLSAVDFGKLEGLAYSRVDPNTANFVTAFNAAKADAIANGFKRIHFGDGTWTHDAANTQDDSAVVTVPNGFKITGNGKGRSIISVTNASNGGGEFGVNVFMTETSAGDILVDGLDFVGDNGTDAGTFTYVLNNQNAFIRTATSAGKDIVIRNCTFRQGWGFSVHDLNTNNERVHFTDNHVENMANGVNICASYSLMARNVLVNTEGFETSGMHNVLANNVINGALGTALNIGGDQTPSFETPGCIVIGNTVNGSSGNGIAVTDGSVGAVIANNSVRECVTGGLIVNGAVNPVHHCVFIGNTFLDNCLTPGANLVGMNIQDGDGGHLVFGNLAVDTGTTPGFNQQFGLSLRVPDCVVEGNVFSGSTIDAVFDGSATNTRFGSSNLCVNGTEQWLGSATRAALRTTGKAAADIVEFYRVWNLSTLEARAYFALSADGTHWWGDNLNLLDTNLYRSAADTLKTDDSLVVGNDLTVTDDLAVGDDATVTGDLVVTSTTTLKSTVTVQDVPNGTDTFKVYQTNAGTGALTYGASLVGRNSGGTASTYPTFFVGSGAQLVGFMAKNSAIGDRPTVQIGDGSSVGGAIEFQNFRWIKDNATLYGLAITTKDSTAAALERITITGNIATADVRFLNCNVGIGSLAPSTLVHASSGSTSDVASRLEATAGSFAAAAVHQIKTATKRFDVGVLGTSFASPTSLANAWYVWDSTAAAFRMAIVSAGRFLFKTTTDDGSTDFQFAGTASLIGNGGTVLAQTNTVTGITNKTFTTPTINGAALSGTLSGAPNFTGAVTFDSTTLAIDATNHRVGFGTASPQVPYHFRINAASTIIRIQNDSSSGFAAMAFYDPSSNPLAGFGTGNTSAAAPYAGNTYWQGVNGADVVMLTGTAGTGTERMRLVTAANGTLLMANGLRVSARATTAATVTHADTDHTIRASANSGAVTVNLLAAATAGSGRRLTVVKTDASANAVTLDGSGSETINGATTLALAAQYDRVTIECDGSNWYRVD